MNKTKDYSLHLEVDNCSCNCTLHFYLTITVPDIVSKEYVLDALERAENLMIDTYNHGFSSDKYSKEEVAIMNEVIDGINEQSLLKYIEKRYDWKCSYIDYPTDIKYCI